MPVDVMRCARKGYGLLKAHPVILLPFFLPTALSIANNLLAEAIFTPDFIQSMLTTFLQKGVLILPPLFPLFVGLSLIEMLTTLYAYLLSVRLAYDAATKKPSLSAAAALAARKFPAFLLGGILFVAVFLAGLLALVIPGIYLTVRLMLFDYEIVVAGKGAIQSLKGSWQLTRGSWWSLFGLGLLLSVPFAIVSSALALLPFPFPLLGVVVDTLIFLPLLFASFTVAYLELKRGSQKASKKPAILS